MTDWWRIFGIAAVCVLVGFLYIVIVGGNDRD
jgi:hypothetical protein